MQPARLCPDSPSVNEAAFTYYGRLCAVKRYATAHANERITLAAVAQVAGLETKYFSAYFHAKTGVTWTAWLRLLRVNRAKELVHAQELSISRLAFASGFSDVRTFERAFKRIVGVPPAVYRAAVRPESR